jgi:4-hydroxybenzoate polyprenyltransferase
MFSERTRKIIAFLRLMRVHRSIPTLLLILPPLILLFSEIFLKISQNPLSLQDIKAFPMILLFFKILLGGFCVRSIGCILNDFFDQKFDANSERTKLRPFVNDDENDFSLKPNDNIVIIGTLILVLISFSLMLSLKFGSIIFCLISIPLIILYPLTKRFLAVPQVFLGFTYAMPILIIGFEINSSIKITHIILYLACSVFTFVYDSIYAMQDLNDDIKNEVNSAPVFLEKSFDFIISKAYNLSFIFFLIFGILQDLSFGFYICLAFSFIFTKYLIKDLNKKENHELQKIFNYNSISLLLILFGVIIDNLINYFFLNI